MLRFQDIMTREIVYFDHEYREGCKAFCRERNIKFLPSLSDPQILYQYDKDRKIFKKVDLEESQQVSPMDDLFSRDALTNLRKHKVLFVMELGVLRGVVHYSDYGQPVVYEWIYKRLYKLERGLVQLITSYGRQNIKTLISFMRREAPGNNRIGSFDKKNPDKSRLIQKKDFRVIRIDLHQLLKFAKEIELFEVKGINRIHHIRNRIAHSQDLIIKKEDGSDSLIYHFETFESMMEGVIALQQAIKQVGNRYYLMKAYLEEDYTLPVAEVYTEAFA